MSDSNRTAGSREEFGGEHHVLQVNDLSISFGIVGFSCLNQDNKGPHSVPQGLSLLRDASYTACKSSM
jgi:hypothetical protein